jgi:hypothetical protein
VVGASKGGLIKSASVTSVRLIQTLREAGAELDTPQANRFAADSDASLGKKILDISVTQIEAIVEPDCVGNDVGRESVTLVSIHHLILSIWRFILSVPD